MKMAHVMVFTGQMEAMSEFYGQVLGLEQVTNEKGWKEFGAGGATIALHSGPSSPGRKGPKIVFYAEDVCCCARHAGVAGREIREGSGRGSVLPSAMGRTRTVIRCNCRIAEVRQPLAARAGGS